MLGFVPFVVASSSSDAYATRTASALATTRLAGNVNLWPAGEPIPYYVNPDKVLDLGVPLNPDDSRVAYAVRHIESRTCLRFTKCASWDECAVHPNFIEFWAGSNCQSPVGRQGPYNSISLAQGCDTRAAIHEIVHTLGLDHEQKRFDRDRFVAVDTKKVVPEKVDQFTKIESGRDMGGYDYRGIMHYNQYAFQQKTGDVTIAAPYRLIGTIGGLSDGDVAALHFLYNGCSKVWTAPVCMASVDSTVVHTIPHSHPFVVSLSAAYDPAVAVRMTQTATSVPPTRDITFRYPEGMQFTSGGAHTQITYTPSADEVGEVHTLAMTVSGDNVEETTCFVTVRVATSDAVCFGKDAADPFVCSGRGACTNDVLAPCACRHGYGGPGCEGDAHCPGNVAETFDTSFGAWAYSYLTSRDNTVRVGGAGASLRLGDPEWSVSNAATAVLPLSGLSMPEHVAFDVAKMASGVFVELRFSMSLEQNSDVECLRVGSKQTASGHEWSMTNPSTGQVQTTGVALVAERFYHIEVRFSWEAKTAAVVVDGVEVFAQRFNPACGGGFDTVTAAGLGWVDNVVVPCTTFVPPQHPETSAPPPTPRPTPMPTPAATQTPQECRGYTEHDATGTVDYPAGDSSYSYYEESCEKLLCTGTVTLTFTFLDTKQEGDFVAVHVYNDGVRTEVARYWGQTAPATQTYVGSVLLRFVSAGGIWNIPILHKGYTVSWTCSGGTAAPDTSAPTPSPPQTQPPATIAPTACPTLAPTETPDTFAPTAFPSFCASSELQDMAVGDVAHGIGGYKGGEEWCWLIQCADAVVVQWVSFGTQADHDFVTLYTQDSAGAFVQVVRASGDVAPADATYHGHVLVHWSSDRDIGGIGFALEYTCRALPVTPAPSTATPTSAPTALPTASPTSAPTASPTAAPTSAPPTDGTPLPSFCTSPTELPASGTLYYPSAGTYPNNAELCWHIACPSQVVSWQWTGLDVEAGYDTVRVYGEDSGSASYGLVEVATGRTLPGNAAHGGDVVVRFTSDYSVSGAGFGLQYACAPVTPTFPAYCDGHGEVRAPGSLVHPAVPGTYYGNNERRCWMLQCAGTVRIVWDALHTETFYDWVHVVRQTDGAVVAQHSGHGTPNALNVAGDVLVHFTSDFSYSSTGFALQWECLVE